MVSKLGSELIQQSSPIAKNLLQVTATAALTHMGVCSAGQYPETLLSGLAICNRLQMLKYCTDINIRVLNIL